MLSFFNLNFAGIDLYGCCLHNSSCHSSVGQALSHYLDSSIDSTVVAGQRASDRKYRLPFTLSIFPTVNMPRTV